MTGAVVVIATLVGAGLLVAVARLVDRTRHVDSSDRWSGWRRGKYTDAGWRLGDGPEYDSMDDHGNRDADGGL